MALTAFLYFKSTNVQVLMCLPFTDENREIVVASGRLPTLVGLLKEDKLVQLVLLVVFNICVDSGMYHILLLSTTTAPFPRIIHCRDFHMSLPTYPSPPPGSNATKRVCSRTSQQRKVERERYKARRPPLLDRRSDPRRDHLARWSG